jgi:prephenate dehydrogenase
MADHFLTENVLIIGTGLIGGSFAKGLRQRHLVSKVTGFGRNQDSLQQGIALGVIDSAASDLDQAIAEADVIMLAVPTLTVADYIERINQHRKATAVVTDAASVKGEIANVIVQQLGELPRWFVLGHPIAGSEKSGISASNANLYVNHKVILTPNDNTDEQALALITALWQGLGADVVEMPIEQHDQVLAATSHLPHALAFALVDCLRDMEEHVEIFRFAAGGFRDFTRIASSHPVMWHDIMLANKEAVLATMDAFKATLADLEQAIRDEDGEAVLAMFERAKSSRDEFAELLIQRQKKSH